MFWISRTHGRVRCGSRARPAGTRIGGSERFGDVPVRQAVFIDVGLVLQSRPALDGRSGSAESELIHRHWHVCVRAADQTVGEH
jgi:hypothetical protein